MWVKAVLVFAVSAAGCGGHVAHRSASPSATPAPDENAPVELDFTSLGHEDDAAGVPTGTWSLEARRANAAACSQGSSDQNTRARFALTLGAGGDARVCWSWSQSTVSSPGDHGDAFAVRAARRRVALSGQWARDGAWLELTLQPSVDAACPLVSEPASLRPLPETLHLRCTEASAPAGEGVLACGTRENERAHLRALTLERDANEWVILGRGAGVLVTDRVDDFGQPIPAEPQMAWRTTPLDASELPAVP